MRSGARGCSCSRSRKGAAALSRRTVACCLSWIVQLLALSAIWLKDRVLLSADEIERESNAVWNPKGRVPVWTWLSEEQNPGQKERLKMLGNAVMPRCGRLAMHLMLHQHQR